jgi:hypothetical protein
MMWRTYGTIMMVAGLAAAGCGGRSDSQRGTAAGQTLAAAGNATSASSAVSRIEPCSLLRKEEIQEQVEQSHSPGQLAGLKSKGVVWTISMESVPQGASRICQVAWQGAVNGEVSSKGDFSVNVTFADWLKGSVAGMKHPLPIPNVGDEAYFVGGKSGPPYARVGDVALGIENFPDTRESKSGLALLRLAVARVPAH